MAVRRIEPKALRWRSVDWGTGSFDSARRSYTARAGGTISLPRHLVLVNLRGGARHLDVRTDVDHSYSGDDRAGAVSVVPAHSRRDIEMVGVASVWASISLDPAVVEACLDPVEIVPVTNTRDPFLAGLAGELERTYSLDGTLDLTYCDAMAFAVAHHLARRYGRRGGPGMPGRSLLPAGRLRLVADYVEAHLDHPLRIRDLAAVAGMSEGHLHRAFRSTTGRTPLEFVTQRRVCRAVELLNAPGPATVIEIALRVGFTSPGHFARVFRRVTGVRPSDVRSSSSGPVAAAGSARAGIRAKR